MKNTGIQTQESQSESEIRDNLTKTLLDCPIPREQLLSNLGLFLNSKNLSRILFMDFIYQKIVDVQGIVIEFGTRWGQNLALFSALRGIYEPFNRHRKIVGFDTFGGFPEVHTKDGRSDMMTEGNLSVTDDYCSYLDNILSLHEQFNPLDHLKKFQLCEGDGPAMCFEYLKNNQETIIALAYFDFDLYEPTKKCLEMIKPRLTRGSIVGFDELNDPDAPGETLALMETVGLNNINLQKYRYASRVSYYIVE